MDSFLFQNLQKIQILSRNQSLCSHVSIRKPILVLNFVNLSSHINSKKYNCQNAQKIHFYCCCSKTVSDLIEKGRWVLITRAEVITTVIASNSFERKLEYESKVDLRIKLTFTFNASHFEIIMLVIRRKIYEIILDVVLLKEITYLLHFLASIYNSTRAYHNNRHSTCF